MSDISILKQMIKEDTTVRLQERKEKTHSKYSVELIERQDNYSVTIDGMPKPDEVIVIRVDEFKLAGEFCNGFKGECKRADFVIIADTDTEKIILCIEMKKKKDKPKQIIHQLKGAKCFVAYCQKIGEEFWNQHKFLDTYQYRFVSIGHIPRPITTIRPKRYKNSINPVTEIHNSPDKMLQLSGCNYFQFDSLI